MGAVIVPDFQWYVTKSRELGQSPRCMYASANRCPRYFASLSLMGLTGATKIDEAEEERLAARWERSGIWPHSAEQGTSISQVDSNGITKTSMYANFCPEVMFDRLGHFASFISDYADEIDRDGMRRKLQRDGAPKDDWRWHWAVVSPTHYSECPLYSLLASATEPENSMDKSTREYLERRLANMAEGVVEDAMLAVTLVMSEAAKQNALGNSRVWLQYNDAIAEAIKIALPQMIRFAFEVSDGRTREAAPILSEAIVKLKEDAKAALIKRTSLSAQAFGEKPMYESLSTKLTKLTEQAIEDFKHGFEGGRRMKKDDSAGINVSVIGSPGAQVGAGQQINQTMNQQSRFLVDAVSNVLASQAFKNLGDDKREIVSGYADFVKGELDKPNPDASKVKSWIEKMQLALTTANLMAEAGTIGMALAAFLGS
jgi:hypothetical protein